ncbi:hypothetical protein BOX15_Mlig031023g1 [Macrostomum lignano]|uniref:Protein kinase domain-containing protein n=2 Tax=Macrostomum lignano TaxID=282301 RepID=A0A267DWK9_9PLAT|nr:hypothetical protein BOX15_Mlig031023g1 [Macrostomum lignano]
MYRERSEFSEKRARLEAELLRAERIQDDLEQRDAEIEELRRQVQQQQQQINEHRQQQQQQQQQQQHPPHPDSRTPMRAAKQPPSSLAAPSPTVNTKEAFKELHSLFRDAAPPRYPREMESMLVDEDEAAGKPAKPPASLQKQQQPQPAFEIFCDQSLVPQQQQQRQQDMQNTQKPAFEIFCDQSLLASEPKRSEQAQFKTPLPPPQPVQQKQQGEFKVPAPPSMQQQQQQQQQQRSNKKGLAPQMPGSAAEQKPQPPADQTTSMSAAVAANLFGSGGETSVIEFTPSSQSTQIIRNPIRQPPVLGSLLERSSGASSASGGVGGSSGADPAAPEAAAEQQQQQQQHSVLANSQASIENTKLHGSTTNASRFAAAAAASLASDSSAALTVVDDDHHRSTSRRRDSPSSSCRRTLIEEDKPETAAGAEAKPPPAAEDEDDTLAAFGIRSAAAASSTMSATVAGRAAACGFSIFGELEDELDNVEDEDEGGAGGAPNQTTIDLSATHTICVPDGLASASALVLSSSAPGAVHLALEPDLPFSQQSAHLWRPNANELKTQFAKDIVRGLGTNPFVNLRRNVRSIVHGSFHYRDIAKLASGAFGEVYTANERKLVLKWQSPPLLEEFLLIRLAHQRLSTQRWPDLPDCRPGLCDAVRVHAFKEASVLVQSCYSTGSLLHLVNRCITERSRLAEPVVAYISLELLYLVCSLHRARLLHADIKPDNLVFLGLPDLRPAVESAAAEGRPIDALSLIRDGRLHSVLLLDFGQAMEFSQLSGEGFVLRLHGGAAAKSRDKASATFLCPQMMSNQVWTCQCDLFNLASVIYCLIFQSYMTVTAGDSGVRLKGAPRLPRGWSAQVWPDLLQELMNSQSELCPTSLARHTAALAEIIHCKIKEYAACFNRPPISPP